MTEPSSVDRSPARLGVTLAAVAGLLATVGCLFGGAAPALAALVGTGLVAGGAAAGRRGTLALGVGLVVTGAAAAGYVAASSLPALLAGAAALFAWDVGENAISVGEQLGADAPTRDLEVVHASASAAVLGASAVAVAVVAGLGFGGRPVAALCGLLVGGLALAWTLRD